MEEKCILYDRDCLNCGECDMCDMNPDKRCDNCGSCLNDSGDYRSVDIKKFFNEHNKDEERKK